MKLDTHVHCWRPDDGFLVRIRARTPELQRRFMLEQLVPDLDRAGVQQVVLVSAAQDTAETRALLAIAQRHSGRVAGVIGFVDLEAPDVTEQLAALQAEPAFAGLRLPLAVLDDPLWLRRPAVRRALDHLERQELIVQFLALPRDLPLCLEAIEQRPGLTALIDHAGNPDVAAGELEPWATALAAIATRTGAWCKLSGLTPPQGQDLAGDAVVLPFFRHALQAFGPDRVITACNWPVSTLAYPYRVWWERLERLCAAIGLNADEQAALEGGNARRLLARTIAGGAGGATAGR